jgi:alcohol dehydrogenase
MDFQTAASLGCRFITAYRAVRDQVRVAEGEWLAVHGCGGVGLSAVMIASAHGADVIAVDINEEALKLAESMGARIGIDARSEADIPAAIQAHTGGGAHASLDALGSVTTCRNSIRCLRKRGRHVQVGLLHGSETPLPMDQVIARELEIAAPLPGDARGDSRRGLGAAAADHPQDRAGRSACGAGGDGRQPGRWDHRGGSVGVTQ